MLSRRTIPGWLALMLLSLLIPGSPAGSGPLEASPAPSGAGARPAARPGRGVNWNPFPGGVVVGTNTGNETALSFSSDGNDGFLAAWFEQGSGSYQLQRNDFNGNLVWFPLVEIGSSPYSLSNGPATAVAPDGLGGAYVATLDNPLSIGTRSRFRLYWFSSNGVPYWSGDEGKVHIAELCRSPQVVAGSPGKAMVAYEVSTSGPSGPATIVQLQRVNAGGFGDWSPDSGRFEYAELTSDVPVLCGDRADGAWVAFVQVYSSGAKGPSIGRVLADGSQAFHSVTFFSGFGGCEATLDADGEGGVFCGGIAGDGAVLLGHYASSPANGSVRVIHQPPGSQAGSAHGIRVCASGTDGAFVVFRVKRDTGEPTPPEAIAIDYMPNPVPEDWESTPRIVRGYVPGLVGTPAVAPDGKGGVIVTWKESRDGGATTQLYSQGYLFSDGQAFPNSGLLVSEPTSSLEGPIFAAPGLPNTTLSCWRTPGGIVAQQISLSNLDVVNPLPGWDAPMVLRGAADASPGNVHESALVEGPSTFANINVRQAGPNPMGAWREQIEFDGKIVHQQIVGDGNAPGDYGAINVPLPPVTGGVHTVRLRARSAAFGIDPGVDQGSFADDVYETQLAWYPELVHWGSNGVQGAPPPPEGVVQPGGQTQPNGLGQRYQRESSSPGTAWLIAMAPRRGPSPEGLSDDYDIRLYDDFVNVHEGFRHQIGASLTRGSGTDFIVGAGLRSPPELLPLFVRYSARDSFPDSMYVDALESDGRRGPGDGASWLGQSIPSGRLADVYELDLPVGAPVTIFLRQRGVGPVANVPLRMELFPPDPAGLYGRGDGHPGREVSAAIETTTVVADQPGPYLLVVFRDTGEHASDPLEYDLWCAASQEPLGVGEVAGRALRFLGATPNPVQGRASFAFELAEPGEASLEVFDLSGRRVHERDLGRVRAGMHRVEWDTRARGGVLDAGVYFARLHAGGQTLTRRFSVLRIAGPSPH